MKLKLDDLKSFCIFLLLVEHSSEGGCKKSMNNKIIWCMFLNPGSTDRVTSLRLNKMTIAQKLHRSQKSFIEVLGTSLRPLGVKVNLSLVMRKPAFCICENKDADQLCRDCEADQRLCSRYIDSKIPLLSKSEISSP